MPILPVIARVLLLNRPALPTRLLCGSLLLLLSCLLYPHCVHLSPALVHAQDLPKAKPVPPRGGYIGDQACAPCHQQQSSSYFQTSHHLASQLAAATTILGSFKDGENILTIAKPDPASSEPRLFFKMENTGSGFRQTAIAEQGSQRLTHSESIDLVIGSGTRGQTYLFRKGDHLLELPVSYWSDGHQWINSPGYKDGTANFDRHVNSRCLECHLTYIQALSADPQNNAFNQRSLIPGIACESCHGPAADHASLQTALHASPANSGSQPNPAERIRLLRPIDPGAPHLDFQMWDLQPSEQEISNQDFAQHKIDTIINPAKLSRDRQIDQCALCHNGTQSVERMPAFTYRPGEPLDRYLTSNPADISDRPDVHGNQVGLLKRSRCFLASPTLSCATCHEPHRPERAAADYSDRCLTCHQWQACGASHRLGISITKNCVDCHMPLQQTDAIASETAGRILHTSIRTHWIAVYSGAGTRPKTAPPDKNP